VWSNYQSNCNNKFRHRQMGTWTSCPPYRQIHYRTFFYTDKQKAEQGAIGRIISRSGLTTRKSLQPAMGLPWADQRIRQRGQLPVAVLFRRLSEVAWKFLRVCLFAKIGLTNGRLARYRIEIVVLSLRRCLQFSAILREELMVRAENMCDLTTPKGILNSAYVFHGHALAGIP
jgi:hypothetical protein